MPEGEGAGAGDGDGDGDGGGQSEGSEPEASHDETGDAEPFVGLILTRLKQRLLTDEQLETARQHEGTASMFGGYSPPTGFAAEILAALLEGGGRAQAQGEGEGDGEGEARAGQRECALM